MASNGLPPSNRSEGQALILRGVTLTSYHTKKGFCTNLFLEGVGGGVN